MIGMKRRDNSEMGISEKTKYEENQQPVPKRILSTVIRTSFLGPDFG
jgi:hypothetical protein